MADDTTWYLSVFPATDRGLDLLMLVSEFQAIAGARLYPGKRPLERH